MCLANIGSSKCLVSSWMACTYQCFPQMCGGKGQAGYQQKITSLGKMTEHFDTGMDPEIPYIEILEKNLLNFKACPGDFLHIFVTHG